jgi:hypothetical protein
LMTPSARSRTILRRPTDHLPLPSLTHSRGLASENTSVISGRDTVAAARLIYISLIRGSRQTSCPIALRGVSSGEVAETLSISIGRCIVAFLPLPCIGL